jgi:hypothetical protein
MESSVMNGTYFENFVISKNWINEKQILIKDGHFHCISLGLLILEYMNFQMGCIRVKLFKLCK